MGQLRERTEKDDEQNNREVVPIEAFVDYNYWQGTTNKRNCGKTLMYYSTRNIRVRMGSKSRYQFQKKGIARGSQENESTRTWLKKDETVEANKILKSAREMGAVIKGSKQEFTER